MSLQVINTPIDPDKFVQEFSKKFQKWGYPITKELEETWKQNCLALNNAIDNKDQALKYVVPAPTGTGKTKNIITYCAMLPKEIKVIISTNLTSEADEIAKEINDEKGFEIACAYHSKNNLTMDDASKYQVVVVTHSHYERNVETSKWEKLGKPRNLIIIDEALSTMVELSITLNDAYITLNFFNTILKQKKYASDQDLIDELDALEIEIKKLEDKLALHNGGIKSIQPTKQMYKVFFNDNQEPYLAEVCYEPKFAYTIEVLENDKFQFNKLLTGIHDESLDQKIKVKILHTIDVINFFEDSLVYITADKGEYSFNTVDDISLHHSVVCFDATADVNKTYELRKTHHEDIIMLPRVENVRDYSPVTLHTINTTTGKDSINDETASLILSNVQLGEKTLIVTHKNNEKFFQTLIKKSYSDQTIEVAHWGAITGLNDWKDFDTCIIVGLNHKPTSFVQNRVVINTGETTAFGEEQSHLQTDIIITDLVSEIVQAMNRIRIRKIINQKGQCDSANIYVTLPTKDYETYKKYISSQMPNINMSDWKLPVASSSGKASLDQVINYLNTNLTVVGTKILLNTPRDDLEINSDTYRSIIGKKEGEQEKFKKKIKAFGYEIVELHENDSRGRQRKKPTKYIQKFK